MHPVTLLPVALVHPGVYANLWQLQYVTPEQAVQKSRMYGLEVIRPDPFGWRTLAYALIEYGSSGQGGRWGHGRLVDAFIGALLRWDKVMGVASAKRCVGRIQPGMVGTYLHR